MSKQRESRRQRRIRRALQKEVGGFWWKQHGGPFTPAGLPDLIGCVEGFFFALEVKEPDSDEPEGSEIQKATAERIREEGHGGVKLGIQEPEEAIEFVKRQLKDKHYLGSLQERNDAEEKLKEKRAARQPRPVPKRRRRVRHKKT